MAEVLRLFLDANVIFSAALSNQSRAAVLFGLARAGACKLVSSGYAVEEARRNLKAKHPDALNRFAKVVDLIEVGAEADSRRLLQAAATGLDPGDVPILAAALGQADALVTGDRKHFGQFMGKKLLGLRILSLAEALALF